MSTSSIFRLLEHNPAQTLILDEVDALFGTKAKAAQNEDLRALLNAGFQRGNPVYRVVGQDNVPQPFETFAPAAMAGIGRLPDTIEDRSIVIPMRRKAANETVAPYRPNRDREALTVVHDRLADWALASADWSQELAEKQTVKLPVDDRAADRWEPLLIVASGAGGDWLKRGSKACKAMVALADEDDNDTSPGQLLLGDIRTVLVTDFMASAALCSALKRLQESPWNDQNLTTHGIGHMLGGYGIKSGHSADKKCRGYYVRDFADAWSRYLPPLSDEASKASEASGTHSDQQERPDTSSDATADPDTSSDADTTLILQVSHQTRRSTPTADTSDASDALSRECPDCGHQLKGKAKCGACIAKRIGAEQAGDVAA